MSPVTLIGISACILTAISMLPQLIKTIKEKNSEDVSLLMIIILLLGLGLWACYGYLIDDKIIVYSNLFSFTINLILIILTIKYKGRH